MAEPQPKNLSSDNMFTALDIVGQTQLAHTGGYKDKMRLGVALGRSGVGVRLAAKQHYHIERLQSIQRSPFVHYRYPKIGYGAQTKESIRPLLQAIKYSPKGTLMPLHAPRRAMQYEQIVRKVKNEGSYKHTYVADRFGKPIKTD